ncbi:MAG: nicotinamide-nucleotide amidohydrolase family protein [Chlamydiia bacterium]|nr:nicotinamide-nucleotide amidohydrolase family protein [Chlamydiia bacterium]
MIELISIGDELLHGATLNTNAQFIARELYSAGFEVQRITTLPDSRQALQAGLNEALRRSKVVITTGGLGPTLDDETKNIVSQMLGSELHFDQKYFDHLCQIFGETRSTFRSQSTVPEKAKLLYNRLGTAPGLVFADQGLILLPGVPSELKGLWPEAFEFIKKRLKDAPKVLHKRMTLALLREQNVDPVLRMLKEQFPELGFGIYPAYGYLGVRISGSDSNKIDAAFEKISAQFSEHVMAHQSSSPEETLHELLIKKNQTLAVAESCTGGLIASKITSLQSASEYFLGGVVSYSNLAKSSLLGVSGKTLKSHGAVSSEVAKEMLAGVFEKFQSNWGIAVTGIAGPTGGTDDKPIGTVWIAMGKKDKEPIVGLVPSVRSGWARQTIINACANFALAGLWHLIQHNTSPFEAYND